MAAYRRVYDSRHLQADCQEPGTTQEPYARQSSMGYLYLLPPASPPGAENCGQLLHSLALLSATSPTQFTFAPVSQLISQLQHGPLRPRWSTQCATRPAISVSQDLSTLTFDPFNVRVVVV